MRRTLHQTWWRASQRLFEHGRGYDLVTSRFADFYERIALQVIADLPEGATVLDAGCGPGRVALAIGRHRPDLTVHGVDLAYGMVAQARTNAESAGLSERVRFTEADLAELPFDDGRFDLVVSTYSFHHWKSVPPIVRELGRVLRPDGRVRIYDARFVNGDRFVESARSAFPGQQVGRRPIRTGWFPIALSQVMWKGPAGSPPG